MRRVSSSFRTLLPIQGRVMNGCPTPKPRFALEAQGEVGDWPKSFWISLPWIQLEELRTTHAGQAEEVAEKEAWEWCCLGLDRWIKEIGIM